MDSPVSYASGANLATTTLNVTLVIFGILGLLIYFIPTFVASKKHHIQKTPIIILNIFLGWTFIGWVVALIWATTQNKYSNTNKIE